MGDDLAGLMDAQKRLSFAAAWAVANEEMSFVVPLEIDGISIPLNLRGRTNLRQPDRDVMFQIEHVPPIGKAEPLARWDWRPFHSRGDRLRPIVRKAGTNG